MHHLTAIFQLLADAPSPKARGVCSRNYVPLHKFRNVEWLASGIHTYEDDAMHYPGETIVARIAFASWEHLQGKVNVGDEFDVLEVGRLIGRGVVTSIP